MNNGLDPITTQVIRNALSSISDEMALVIMRTAYSSIVRDSMDYSTGLCDRQGRVIAAVNVAGSAGTASLERLREEVLPALLAAAAGIDEAVRHDPSPA